MTETTTETRPTLCITAGTSVAQDITRAIALSIEHDGAPVDILGGGEDHCRQLALECEGTETRDLGDDGLDHVYRGVDINGETWRVRVAD